MSDRGRDNFSDDLRAVAERLREERPLPEGLVLDQVKTRAQARAAAARPRAAHTRKGALLNSRIAITAILAVGILMALSGAGLAISGLADSGGGADVQYSNDSNSTTTLGDPGDSGDSGGSSGSGGTGGASGVDPAGQESAGGTGGELAFTGFLAIPVLVGGIVLLGSGLVLRRRAAE